MLGLVLVLLSVRSRWAVAGWAVLVVCVTLGQVGAALDLPGWLLGLSPYHHVPKYPAEAFAWTPEVGLAVVAALAVSGAWWRYRSRDIG